MFTWCGRGGQPLAAGSNPYSRPRRALVLAPRRPGGTVQASSSPTEAQAGIKRRPGQASGRGGQGALALLFRRVSRCSGPPSAEQGPVPPVTRALGPGHTGRTRPGRGAEGARGALDKAVFSSTGWSPNAVRRGAAGYSRLSAQGCLSLHGAGASATPRSTLRSWAAAGPTRPAAGYVGLPLGARGEPP
ncbi:hypothetical protein NDU88_003137 [Pleurodeles waltl]|uniref:Uncharacterized protein n=1 Tax=Pleurodeles waltl TaxID=8319 RepID=A0AAV7UBP0_PLEWA|nr:hypothetical protein NDU88_003137 [Pleurodeles waltl]